MLEHYSLRAHGAAARAPVNHPPTQPLTPPPSSHLPTSLGFLALDLIQWFPLNCAYDDRRFTAWDALLTVTAAPLMLFILALVGSWCYFLARAVPRPGERVVNVLSYLFQALLLVLPTISRRVCQTLRCV